MTQTEHLSELYCPGCGYDLRAIASDRCPECGLAIDRAAIAASDIPWSHRQKIGRVNAFVRTLWMVMSKPKVLARQIASPVSYADAQKFRWIVVAIACLPLIAAAVVARAMQGPTFFRPNAGPNWPLGTIPPSWDLIICLMVGVDSWIIPSLAIVLFVAVLTGLPSYFAHPNDLPPVLQDRAIALSYYTCAPLTLCALPLVLTSVAMYVEYTQDRLRSPWLEVTVISTLFGMCSILLTFPLFWAHSLQLLIRVTHASVIRGLMIAVLLSLGWLLMAALCLVVFIGLGGLVRLMIESMMM